VGATITATVGQTQGRIPLEAILGAETLKQRPHPSIAAEHDVRPIVQ
jgi:hypothetical protein